jgi:TonB family protein
VIGLNPSANLNAPIPEASRQVEISVGPPGGKGRSSGADKDAVQVGDLNVTVRGGQGGAAKALPESPPRPKAELISATIFISAQEVDQRRGMYSVPVKVERMSVAERVKSTFQGRNFYLLIVQRPNTGNYSQDWMLWFAERTPLPGDSPRVHPPIPFRIVDPASVKSTISKQFEGTVQLGAIVRKTGFVDDVRILSGFDDTFDQAAREALRRWTFVPALRSGIMVDVDVVVEIPFLARPKEQIAGANGGSK